jgi:uncharacterized protein (TIGR03663 family)
MHTDEAINAYITGDLLAGKPYQYDPRDRHGPVLYAVALPVAKLAGVKDFPGMTETSVRIGPAVMGALTILLFGLLLNTFGPAATIGAAAIFALSPISVYYSRDFIHETFFVAATLWTIAFAFRLLQENRLSNAIALGVGAALMLACKETAVLHFAAFAVVAFWWLVKTSAAKLLRLQFGQIAKPVVAAAASFLIVLIALFTWGGTRWQGLLDLGNAIPHLTSRASGEGHQKPMWYYIALLGENLTGIVVLCFALVSAASVRWKKFEDKTFPALVTYTVVVTLLYSLIPYKTPWLALNLWLPLALLAGNGFGRCWQKTRNNVGRGCIAAIAAICLIGFGHETWRRVFVAPADERNPYAYSQTVEDFLRLPDRVQQLAAKSPVGNNIPIAVIAADPWPLPWYLRKFPNTGFWQPGQEAGPADIYITSAEVSGATGVPWEKWRPEFFGVRPEVLMLLWTPPETVPPHE